MAKPQKEMNRYIPEQEMKDILDLALKRQMETENRKKGKVDLKHIISAAGEMGISAYDIEEALNTYNAQKQKKKMTWIISGAVLGLLLLAGAGYWWTTRPRIFHGNYRAVFTHNLTPNKYPVHNSKFFGLNQKKVYLHITWLDLKKTDYNITYRWLGPHQNLIHIEKYKLKVTSSPYRSWTDYSPKASDPTGKWTIQVILDKMKVGEFSFDMTKKLSNLQLDLESSAPYSGDAKVTFTTKIDGSRPADSITQIKSGRKVYAHIRWYNISGSHLVKWRWMNPKNETTSFETLDFSTSSTSSNWGQGQEATTWNTWDSETLKMPGKHSVYIFIDNYFVKKLDIEVTK